MLNSISLKDLFKLFGLKLQEGYIKNFHDNGNYTCSLSLN